LGIAGRIPVASGGRVFYAGDRPLHVDVPDSVIIGVAKTAAPVHGAGAASNIRKEATLENGPTIRVPLFIETGDAIGVNCQSRQYVSKAN
jgi:elongation factor P